MLGHREMFDYFKRERARLMETLEKLSNEELGKNRELSFPSIRDVLVHTVIVQALA